jgi:Spy/CpxP family protein refolding chaperone
MQFALGFVAAFVALAAAGLFRARRWHRGRPAVALGGRRWPFRRLFARLDTSPAQEQVLVDETAALREDLRSLRAEWAAAREELGALLGEPSLDASRIEAVLATRDARLAALRRRAAEAAARFHAVLDDAQRKTLAALVREGRVLAPAHAHRRC